MTDAQAVQIKELRMKGMGYRTIAETVGLTRDTVRNYCKANDMAGYATVFCFITGHYISVGRLMRWKLDIEKFFS